MQNWGHLVNRLPNSAFLVTECGLPIARNLEMEGCSPVCFPGTRHRPCSEKPSVLAIKHYCEGRYEV